MSLCYHRDVPQNSPSRRLLNRFRPRNSEGEPEPRIVAELSAEALHGNYDAIRAQVPGKFLIPMIKANAYGHGAAWAARQLQGVSALFGLGVASLEEGREVREELGPKGRRTRIFVFSGAEPWSEQKGEYCENYGLTATIASEPDWRAFVRGGWPARVAYQLKFNTGMNRLGLAPSSARAVAAEVKRLSAVERPICVLSHLASGENPTSQLSRTQAERFRAVRSEFDSLGQGVHFSLANSNGIWNARHWRVDELTDIVRPGISLYGVAPWKGAPARGLTPVLTLKARVCQINRLKPGERIGYGGTYRAAEPEIAAILSAGYGDGVLRSLSNRGHAWLDGKPTRFIGIVSMDLSAVRAFPGTKPGAMAEILGPNVDVWAQAEAAGSIPYELFTSLTSRVKRIYG